MNNRTTSYLLGLLVITPYLHADQFSSRQEAANILGNQQWEDNEAISRAHLPPHEDLPLNISFSGFVKHDSFYDTRQVLSIRAGQLVYFPLAKDPDINGNDINDRGQFNMGTLQTRIRTNIIGPDIGCVRSRAYIEADFFGNVEPIFVAIPDIISFRMRHAYLELNWDHGSFLAGQTWHPIYYPVGHPDTIGHSQGVPIAPFVWNPQLRLGYHHKYFDTIFAVIGTVPEQSYGPDGQDTKYFRNTMVPEFHGHVRYTWSDALCIGIGVNYKRLLPRLVTNEDIATHKELKTMAAMGFLDWEHGNFSGTIKCTFAQNAADFNMIGGYAVSSVNPVTDVRTYTPLQTFSVWTEIVYNHEDYIEPALFFGYAKNLGAQQCIITSIPNPPDPDEVTVYGLGYDINNLIRVAPRVRFYYKSFISGIEIETTRAAYGTLNNQGHVIDTDPVTNVRFLLSHYYVF